MYFLCLRNAIITFYNCNLCDLVERKREEVRHWEGETHEKENQIKEKRKRKHFKIMISAKLTWVRLSCCSRVQPAALKLVENPSTFYSDRTAIFLVRSYTYTYVFSSIPFNISLFLYSYLPPSRLLFKPPCLFSFSTRKKWK